MVLGMVPFNMSLNLLCPDKALTTYPALVFVFLCMTALMWFQILLHFSAKVIADSTNKHFTSMGFCMCYKITFHLKSLSEPFFTHIHILNVRCTILWVASSLSNAKPSSHLSHTNCLFRLCEYKCQSRVLGQLKVFLHTGQRTWGWLLL